MVQILADGVCHRQYVAEVCGAILSPWRANCNELQQPVLCSFGRVYGEIQAFGANIAANDRLKSRFVDGHDAAGKGPDFVRIDIDTNYMISSVCEAGAGHQSHIAGTPDGYSHDQDCPRFRRSS